MRRMRRMGSRRMGCRMMGRRRMRRRRMVIIEMTQTEKMEKLGQRTQFTCTYIIYCCEKKWYIPHRAFLLYQPS